MENWRLLLAIGLSFLIFLLWSIAFAPKQPVKPETQTTAQSTTQPASQAPPNAMVQTPSTAPGPDARALASEPQNGIRPARPARHITVQTPLFRAVLSEQGAAVISMVLHNYKETIDAQSPDKELLPKELSSGTALVALSALPGEGPAQGLYTAVPAADAITVEREPQEVQFRYTIANQVQILKAYRFSPDSYLVDLNVTITNDGAAPLGGELLIGLRDHVAAERSSYGFEGPSGLVSGHLEQVQIKKIEDNNKIPGQMNWIAIERLYFMDALICKNPVEGYMALGRQENTLRNDMVLPLAELPPGDQRTFEFSLFMGPKSISILKSAGHRLDRALDFGWVDIIARPCLYFMNFIHKYIPNYGIAIIILTIITRLIFWPLAQKSYKSMNDMRKLQPLMLEIRERYKDDKARMNQETMALYRTYKINPIGGCLPMVIQLPVFFALYRMLYQAIELRHAPFFGWINDLSAPDRLFDFGFSIPFMTPPFGIPVLTLIMGATMLLQQKMSPPAGDPAQAKIMMVMPVVFTFIFINFPSGLVLYWLVSNLVSIAQQYLTMRKAA